MFSIAVDAQGKIDCENRLNTILKRINLLLAPCIPCSHSYPQTSSSGTVSLNAEKRKWRSHSSLYPTCELSTQGQPDRYGSNSVI